MRHLSYLALGLILLIAARPAPAQDERAHGTSSNSAAHSSALGGVILETVDGERLEADAVHFISGKVLADTATGTREFSYIDLAKIQFKLARHASSPVEPRLFLGDGTELSVREFSRTGNRVNIVLADGSLLELPVRAISMIVFKAIPAAQKGEWETSLQAGDGKTAGDTLLIRQGAKFDSIVGISKDVTAEKLNFELDGEDLPLNRNKAHTLRMHRLDSQKIPKPVAMASDVDGHLIPIQKMEKRGNTVHITTPLGIEIERPLNAILAMDFGAGSTKLTSLEAEKVSSVPYFGGNDLTRSLMKPRTHTSFYGPLQLGGKTYDEGISLRSRTEITYRLPEAHRFFTGLVGINDTVKGLGSVRFVIKGDGREIFSGTISGTEAPKALRIPVEGVKRLTFEVDYGENADIGDVLDIVQPRLVK